MNRDLLMKLFHFAPDDAGTGAGAPPPPPDKGEEKQAPPPPAGEGEKKDPAPKKKAEPEKDGKGKKGFLQPTQSDADKKPPQAEAKSAEGDESTIEVKLPDGVKLDEAALAKAMPIFKELKLNSEQASKLALVQVEIQKEQAAAQQKAWEAKDAAWAKELESDKELGGKNLEASSAAAQKAVMKFGGRELAEVLEQYGLSNHPVLARTFARIGKADAEDTSRVDSTTKPSKPTEQEKLAKRYTTLAKDLTGKQE